MLSALKKLVGSEPPVPPREKNIPAGLQSMNQSLQRRFAKGVQYNMKIVIRGDRNTGKSTLWQRLQGGKFQEEYIPTQEIQVTSIHWNYKTTDDVVKVEVWDVVDKGKSKKRGDALKLENEPQEAESEIALDAEFLDVYKNCNGVIMMFDITKQWTYSYILRELPRVPTHVPVCVLGNHRDMGEHRVILPDDIRDFISGMNRPLGSSYIHYAESSMKNGFGLKYLHRFFNIPFLQLQRETLLRQLETNQLDMDATLEELTVQQETEDQNYDIFLEMMDSRSKGCVSPGADNGQSPSSGSQSPMVAAGGSSTGSSSPGTPQQPAGPAQSPQSPSPSPPPLLPSTQTQERPAPSPAPPTAAPAPAPSPAPAPAPSPVPQPQKRSFISRLFGSSPAPDPLAPEPEAESGAPEAPPTVQSVDDFVPDDGLDKSFLEDSMSSPPPPAGPNIDSDGEGGGGGGDPMVAGYQIDLDLDDSDLRAPVPDVTLSSDEEVGGAPPVVTQDEDVEFPPTDPLEDLSSLTLEEKPKPTEPNILIPTPAPSTHTPAPSTHTPAPSTHTPAPSTHTPAPSTHTPAPSTHTPAPSTHTPAPSTHTPAPSTHTQVHTPAPAAGPQVQHCKKKPVPGDSSDTDPEEPAAQMLSFIMDDPDFESEEELVQKVNKEDFPVRVDLSDISDEELVPAKVSEPQKVPVRSFKQKNDSDLFGLGFEEKSLKNRDSSEEQEEKESRHSVKEKKRKKKKTKEDEEKSSKKKHKHKKKEEEAGTGEEKKKKKSRSKKSGELDDLEAFLAGGAGSARREEGDYEEL
ncbi:rab-like protein 6 isoform X2 [Astyanax mexicanus]|uniref:rab-like protein 6 isoform X2 n=1 Tax=Astyanax mexicanus TaxID=7994 RepID=UPI0020CB22DB|nr:rab-like protein 6 isoform X2 [Astyanax mexicanus]